MRIATLLSWAIQVSLGAFMLRSWLAGGGPRREASRSGGLPPQLILAHMGLALAGFGIWAGYVVTGLRPMAWLAVSILTVVIAFGICTVTLWTPYPLREPVQETAPPAAGGLTVTDEMIEQFFEDPFPQSAAGAGNVAALVPLAHGIGAITTFVLAVMTAITT